ncbi:hypothetical protein J6590_105438, partial [Homalodisca vitripennis]
MDALSEPGHTEKVVMYLLSERFHSGHSVFADNFYSSVGGKRVVWATSCFKMLPSGRSTERRLASRLVSLRHVQQLRKTFLSITQSGATHTAAAAAVTQR